ncbi:MAG: hypothetical protein GF392_01010, partial [Candidatus Omnitrophica bacterium]|nr:hypothetical protein [Candidatus Omnitrophota bacterium]
LMIEAIQEHVQTICGEVSHGDRGDDAPGRVLTRKDRAFLDGNIRKLEEEGSSVRGFRLPGGSEVSAFIDIARTGARRAERSMVELNEQNAKLNANFLVYLNRLSTLLYIMAGRYDPASGVSARSGK